VIASLVTGWCLIGDKSENDPHLSYMIRAPQLPTAVLVSSGVASAVALVWMIRWAWPWRAAHRPAVALAFSGFGLSFIGRLVTAGSIGANIGGGMAVLFLLPPYSVAVAVSFLLFVRRTR
jgi:hypothetical protein